MMKSAKKWLRQNATNGMYRSLRRRVEVFAPLGDPTAGEGAAPRAPR